MSTIFGLAKLTASDYAYVNNANQELIYEATQQYLTMANDAAMKAMETFVEPTPTTNFKERYKLPLIGRMQKASEENTGKSVAQSGSWDVAYPLDNYHERITISDVDAAYMTPAEFQMHIDGVIGRHLAAKRHAILYRLFNNTQDTFVDKRHGSLTIEPLANGDSVVYPPVEGTDSTEATDNHYLESGYLSAAISDTNNPVKTLVNELVEHGIDTTDDVPIAVMIHPDEQDAIEALTNFVPYIPPQITPGMDTDQILMPPRNIPGKIIGYIRGYAWISVWRWIPSGYLVASNLAAPQPLKMRVDPQPSLGNGGLQLLPEERFGVLTYNSWRLRFGMGAANRLSAAVMELGTGGTYTIPTAYQ